MASHRLDWRRDFPAACRHGAVAIGNFDGAHRGHATLVRELARAAHAAGGPAVAVTFDPHPLRLLRPEVHLELLTTADVRATELERLGADEVVILAVDPGLLQLGAADFFEQVIRGRLTARALVEGPNFAFGRNREGDLDLLARLCRSAGLSLDVVEPVTLGGAAVSSSRIRAELLHGDVAAAARCLGRPYRLAGRVGTGRRRGRTIGFPTANLEGVETVVPGDGVYAVAATLPDGSARRGAANVGPNPTFGEQARKIEVHLLDFSGDLYGKELLVDFIARLRDTRPFPGPEALLRQLEQDVAAVRTLPFPVPGETP